MSAILKAWLTEELGFAVDNVEKEFSTGFLFGQLLSLHNMQPDFSQFISRNMPDAMINNYTRLQPTLTKLGVKMDSEIANRLMREEARLAPQLLLSIKQSLNQLDKDLQKFSSSGRMAASMSPSRGLLEAQQYSTARESYDQGALRFFEDAMRLKADNPNALMESLHLARFTKEGARQEAAAVRGLMAERTGKDTVRSTFRHGQLDKMCTVRSEKSTKLTRDDMIHAALLKRKEEAEREDLRVELALNEKAARRRLGELTHASLDVHHGIDAFEINMKRLVKADAPGEGEEGAAAEGLGSCLGKNPMDQMNRICALAAAGGKGGLEDTALYMKGVKEGRAEDVAAQKEREARRRKLLVEQQAAAKEAESKSAADALVATLARLSGEEQRTAARLWQLSQEKEVMRANRVLREEQYAERRNKDWDETIRRETELHRSMKQQYEAEAKLEMEAWRLAQQKCAVEKAAKHAAIAEEVAWQLVMLAERTSSYRETTGTNVPRRDWREWLAMFTTGDPALGDPVVKAEDLLEAARDADARLATATATEYLTCIGDFDRLSEGPIGSNSGLGAVVAQLAKTSRPQPPPPQLPQLEMPLRLAVVGATFAGKSTVAQELSKRFRLRVLDPESLMAEAIKAAAAFEKELAAAPSPPPPATASGEGEETDPDAVPAPAEPPPPEPSQKAALGQKVQAALQAGLDIPDQVLVDLVVLGMAESKEWAPPPELDAKGKPKTPSTPKTPKGAPPPTDDKGKGFVLDGFPRTAAQAALLERVLTGLDLDSEQALIDSASRLAPPPEDALPHTQRPLSSGLDAVLVLSLVDDSLALKRAVGRRVDPLTGKVYHLEFDPPPANDPGLSARLKNVKDESNDAAQVQQRLSTYASVGGALDTWIKRFRKLRRPIEGSNPLPEVLASAGDVCESILRAHAASASARSASDAAHKARASAELAQEFAETAQRHAEGAARELLTAKKAEIQATALLVDPKSKNPDPAAAEVLKVQAAARCGEQLKVCRSAAADAAGHAERAGGCAVVAAEAATRADRCLGDAEVSAHAEVEAQAAASDAEAASKAAAAAAAKAEAAQAAAEVAVAEAERVAGSTDLAADAQLSLTTAEAAAAVAAATAAAAAEEAGPAAPSTSPIDRTLAEALYEEWKVLEASYMRGLAMGFADLSDEQAQCVAHFAHVRQQFKELLARPDAKPTILSQFLTDFNAVDVDVRRMKETQAELLLRNDELREALWGVCDRKADEAEAERAKVMADSFVADHTALASQHFTSLVQVEIDRFTSTVNFLKSAVQVQYGVLRSEAEVTAPDVMSGVVPPELKDKIDPKSKTVLSFPVYISRLEPKSAALATATKVAWAAAKATASSLELPPVDTKKSKKEPAAKGKKKGEEEAPADDAPDAAIMDAISAQLLDLVSREVSILESRLGLLADRALSTLIHISELSAATSSTLTEWIRARYQGECSAVAALEKVVRSAAFEGKLLPYDLRLEDEQLIIDETQLITQPPAELPEAEPVEEQPPAGMLSTKQLGDLVAAFKAVAPAGFMRLGDAADMLCRMAGEGVLPAGWRTASTVQMLSAMRMYDPVYSTYLDWREFVASLITAACPLIAKADCAEMADQVDILADADGDSDGLLTEEEWLDTELWFQYKAHPQNHRPNLPSEVAAGTALPKTLTADQTDDDTLFDEEAQAAAAAAKAAAAEQEAAAAASGAVASNEDGGGSEGGEEDVELEHKPRFDSAGALKRVLWTAFATPKSGTDAAETSRGGSELLLDYTAVLLYLCADRDAFSGIKKAFCVASNSIAPNARATAEQIHKVAYPLGPEAGSGICRSAVTLTDIETVVKAIYDSRGGNAKSEARISAEQLMYSVAGDRVVKQTLDRYGWKDAYTATRL